MKAVLLVAILGLSVCTVRYRRDCERALAIAEDWKRAAEFWRTNAQYWENSATNAMDMAERAVNVAEFWQTNPRVRVQITITNNPAFELPRAYERSQPSSL